MNHVKMIVLLVSLLLVQRGLAQQLRPSSPNEAAVRANAEAYEKAFNSRDAKALAEFWSPEAVYTNRTTGEQAVGRAAIAEEFQKLFKEQPELKLDVQVESIQFVSPNVAVEQGTARWPNGQPVATTADYAQQASTIAASAPATNPQAGQWLPLGVFAVTQDGQATGEQPALYVQLAVSKDGAIAGTQKHMATGVVDTLEGAVDRKSQRVAWGVKDQQWPIIETGLSNLTQDSTPALIHFADGQTQQWLLVHLPDPNKG